MEILELIAEIKEKEQFIRFMQENPDSYLTAVFVVLDESRKDTYQLDFFIPSKQKIAIATYPFEEIIIQPDEIRESSRLDTKTLIEISSLKEKAEEAKIKNNLEKIKITKIIGILKDDIWNLTCISPTLDILKICINSLGEITKFQKSGLIDFVVKK